MVLVAKLKLKETNRSIKTKIIGVLRKKMTMALRKAAPRIKKRFKVILEQAIIESPTYQEMFGGDLQGELGFTDPQKRLDGIVKKWVDTVNVKTIDPPPSVTRIRGGLIVEAIQRDWKDVLSLEEATFTTPENKFILEWLEWLLIRGADTIIEKYDVELGEHGRTGLAIMVSENKDFPNRKWSIPPAHQGTIDNNWVTEQLKEVKKQIPLIIKQEIKKAL